MEAIVLSTLLLCTAQNVQHDILSPHIPALLSELHEALENINNYVATTSNSDVELGYRRLKRLLGSWLFGFDVRLLADEDEAIQQRSPLRGVEVLPLYLMVLRCGHFPVSAFLSFLQDALPAAALANSSSSLLVATAQELLLSHDSTTELSLMLLSHLLFESMEKDSFCSLFYSVCSFVLCSFPAEEGQHIISTVFTELFTRVLAATTFSLSLARNLVYLIHCTEEIGITSPASWARYAELVTRMKTQANDSHVASAYDAACVNPTVNATVSATATTAVNTTVSATVNTPASTPTTDPAGQREELQHCFATLFTETLLEGVSVEKVLLPLVDYIRQQQDIDAEKFIGSLLLLLLRKLFATTCSMTASTETTDMALLQNLVNGLHKLLTLAQGGSTSNFLTLTLAVLIIVVACCERLEARGLESSHAFMDGEKLFLSDYIETEAMSTGIPLLFTLTFVDVMTECDE